MTRLLRCDACGWQRPIIKRSHRGGRQTWQWCGPCAEKLERARRLVLDDQERVALSEGSLN